MNILYLLFGYRSWHLITYRSHSVHGQIHADAHAVRGDLDWVLQKIPQVIIVVYQIYCEAVCFNFVPAGFEIGIVIHENAVIPPVQYRMTQFVGAHKAGAVFIQFAVDEDKLAPLHCPEESTNSTQRQKHYLDAQFRCDFEWIMGFIFSHQGIRYALLIHSVIPPCISLV